MTSISRAESFIKSSQNVVQPVKGGDKSSALRELAAFHMLYGCAENAEHFLRIALWLNPKDGQTLRLLAHALARRGNAVEAAKMMLIAAKSSNSLLRLGDWKEVGLALLRQGERELGLKFLAKKNKPVLPH